METLYRKVEIRSEKDLPKEDGFYIASCKNYAVLEYHYCSEVKRDWLKEVDWYLLPLESEPPVYDEQYINDCIEKATPGLSKIKDVDKALDEIRGIEPDLNTPFFGNTGAVIPSKGNDIIEEKTLKGLILEIFKNQSTVLYDNGAITIRYPGSTIEDIISLFVSPSGEKPQEPKQTAEEILTNLMDGHGFIEINDESIAAIIKAMEEYAQGQQPEQPSWDNSKVIDFVNWYLRLCFVRERFQLENQDIIESFLKGDDYKVWWRKVDQPDQPKKIRMTSEEYYKNR